MILIPNIVSIFDRKKYKKYKYLCHSEKEKNHRNGLLEIFPMSYCYKDLMKYFFLGPPYIMFHIKCENVSIALYEVLNDQKNKCHWFFSGCEVGAKKLYLQITALTSQQINMNKHIDTIQNQVDSIKHDFEDIHTRTNKTEKLVRSMENKTSGQLSELTKIIQTLETVDRPETNSNAGAHPISKRDSSRLQYKIRQEV